MKKFLSLFLALILLLSVCGCTQASQPQATQPQATQGQAELFTVPDLTGLHYENLPQSHDYTVQISHRMENAGYMDGEVISQAPVAGADAEKGSVIYIIIHQGGDPWTDETKADPQPTEPTQPPYIFFDPEDQEDSGQTDYPDYPDYPAQPDTQPQESLPPQTDPPETQPKPYLDPNGTYTTKNDVALYIHLYGRLPYNFVTKRQAENLYGWDGGSLSQYGKCIGGDRFYNNEGRLPSGYTYYECDIDTLYSSKRGSKRLVFTYSGIVYYTSDHYRTFTRIY